MHKPSIFNMKTNETANPNQIITCDPVGKQFPTPLRRPHLYEKPKDSNAHLPLYENYAMVEMSLKLE